MSHPLKQLQMIKATISSVHQTELLNPRGENYHLRFLDISLWGDREEEMETGYL